MKPLSSFDVGDVVETMDGKRYRITAASGRRSTVGVQTLDADGSPVGAPEMIDKAITGRAIEVTTPAPDTATETSPDPVANPRRNLPRMPCPVCGTKVAISASGAIRQHKRPDGTTCRGVAEPAPPPGTPAREAQPDAYARRASELYAAADALSSVAALRELARPHAAAARDKLKAAGQEIPAGIEWLLSSE